MQNKKYTAASIFAVGVLLVVTVFVFRPDPKTARRLPDFSKRSGEVTISSELLNIQKAAEFYRFEIRQNPSLVKNYVQLAQLYLQQARISGRHHYYVAEARELLDQALSREPGHFEAMITRASVMLKLHRFEEGRNLADRAVAKNSFNAFSWGVLSDALKELGDYEGAVKACDKMLSLRPDLRSYARAAHLREIHGDLAGARLAMKMACDAGAIGLETRAWSLYQLGNLYFKEGKLDTAEYIYQGILEERPDYPYALNGLAQIFMAAKDYPNALQIMLKAYEIAPEHEFMEQIIEIYRASGQTKTAENLAASVLVAFKQHEEQGWNVNLEYARFCANQNVNLEAALTRIEKEYARRPSHIEVLETYAKILLKKDRAEEASVMLEKARRFNRKEIRANDIVRQMSSRRFFN